MKRLIVWFNRILKKQKKMKRWQRLITVMASLIIFGTTYALILPAITVERDTADEVAGMYLDSAPEVYDAQEDMYEDAAIPAQSTEAAENYTVNVTDLDGRVYDISIPNEGYISMQKLIETLGTAYVSEEETATDGDSNDSEGAIQEELVGEAEDSIVNQEESVEVVEDAAAIPEEALVGYDENEDASPMEESVGESEENEDAITPEAPVGENEDEKEIVSPQENQISNTTKAFVAAISNVEFSNPDLIWVGKIDEEATVGAIKERNNIGSCYNADFTEDELTSINNQMVEAGDWILIHTHPFAEPETLTVSMVNGDIFTINVTDDQIRKTEISAKGATYEITVTYDSKANIPSGAELVVRKIEEGSEEYNEYANEAWLKMNEEYFAENEGNDPASENKEPVYLKNFLQAVFFDISFTYNGKKIEPDAPVRVNINLKDGLESPKDAQSSVVHFAKNGTEIIDKAEVRQEQEAVTEFEFEQGSFSVDGVVTYVDANGTMTDNTPLPKVPPEKRLLRAAATPPQAHKTKTENGDGTYKITLDVTGSSKTNEEVTKSNIIIVLDESTSMYFGKYLQITNATNGQLDPGFQIDNSLTYYYAPADGYVTSSLLDPYGTAHVTTYPLRINGNLLYRGNQPYTGPVYVFKSRFEAEQEALAVLFHDLLAHNKPGQTTSDGVSLDDVIEIALVGFNNGAWLEQDWTTSETVLNNRIANITLRDQTHWWDALDKARTVAANKRADQPDEDVHIIFLTDGEPLRITYTMGFPTGHEKNWNGCLQSAAPYTALLQDYLHLYGIFTYGDMQDLNPTANLNPINPLNTAEDGWAGRYPISTDLLKLINYAYDRNENATNYEGEYFFDAKTIEEVREAFASIFSDIVETLAYGKVTLTDGLTTNASATALVSGKADGFTYEVSGSQNYTVTATTPAGATEPVVTFKVGDQTAVGTPEQVEIDGVQKTFYQAEINGATYRMTLADLNNNGELTWDLGGMGILEDGCTYSVSFDMWPNQDAYDTLADLNNGKLEWDESKQSEYIIEKPDGTSVTYYINSDYPDITKDANGVYSVLTNTGQSMTYSVATTVNGVTTYEGPYTEPLYTPEPMQLVDRKVQVQKEWDDSLDQSQLNELVAEAIAEGTSFDAHLELKKGSNTYLTGLVISPVWDTGGNIQRIWPEKDDHGEDVKHDISAGLMVSEEKAKESGLYPVLVSDPNRYPTVECNGTTYFILESGHDYSFTENPIDPHFELEEKIFHPMVVDNELKDVALTMNGNTGTAEISDLDTDEHGNPVVSATNVIKGGINVQKKVFDPSKQDVTEILVSDDTFKVKVTLTNKDGVPYENWDYRIYYGQNNPNAVWNEANQSYGRSGHNYGQSGNGGIVEVELYIGDVLRIINVPAGTIYSVEETEYDDTIYTLGSNYSFTYTTGGENRQFTTDGNGVSYMISEGESDDYVADNRNPHAVKGNSASQAIVVNTVPTAKIKLLKLGDALTPLNDVTFKLFYDEDCTKLVTKDSLGNELPSIDENGVIRTGTDGYADLGTLSGIYYLKEIQTVAQYIPFDEPIKITITKDPVDPNKTKVTAECDQDDIILNVPDWIEEENGTWVIKINNPSGLELPNTGGPGTLLYTLSGFALILAAALMYGFRMRRRERRLN